MPHLNRRQFLQSTALSAGIATFLSHTAGATERQFQHGVASGDPTSNSVVLWTRLTPTPEAIPGSGLGPDSLVTWQISTVSDFSSIMQAGTIITSARSDHTVHIHATGLSPSTRYFYRFISHTGEISPIGQTQTTLLVDAPLPHLRFVFASCANWEAGFFAAYGDIARRAQAGEFDVLVFLGDYIYEYATGMFAGKDGVVRQHHPAHETITLDHYRSRYGHYRTDTHLQAAHAALPWIVMWDDHESANDAHREGAQNHSADEGSWADRKDAARQAFLEWMPIRQESTLYRTFNFGDLATLSLLDLRSFRDAPPSFEQWIHGIRADTMMGSEQFRWLKTNVEASTTTWNIIGSSVMFAPMAVTGQPLFQIPEPIPANMDQWDGYSLERNRLLEVLAGTSTPTIFLSGDIHSEWANSIRINSQEIGVEAVCSSITSANVNDFASLPEDNPLSLQAEQVIRSNSSHVRHVDLDAHGYATMYLTQESVQFVWHRVADLSRSDSAVSPAIALEWKPGLGFTS
ncbi:phosphodiesterase/alkaline phosphatase D [Corynebacterium suranareeae]|uniref:Phosphodiesterase/alkaline phosphatase D n=1 Tax=Corynebacterium suranareeae TaxID=2506452 RepID=A0A160PV79_9CORY|nr:alkaline phosphatase D family protein [Corynebacterium suranareeae]BAU96590.1 phosphodiesterase/alkaline phosphatase D [Corynebacterium suranareeae]